MSFRPLAYWFRTLSPAAQTPRPIRRRSASRRLHAIDDAASSRTSAVRPPLASARIRQYPVALP